MMDDNTVTKSVFKGYGDCPIVLVYQQYDGDGDYSTHMVDDRILARFHIDDEESEFIVIEPLTVYTIEERYIEDYVSYTNEQLPSDEPDTVLIKRRKVVTPANVPAEWYNEGHAHTVVRHEKGIKCTRRVGVEVYGVTFKSVEALLWFMDHHADEYSSCGYLLDYTYEDGRRVHTLLV